MARIDPATLDPRLPMLALGAAVAWVLFAVLIAWVSFTGPGAGHWSLLHAVLLGVACNAVAGAGLQLGCAVLGAPAPRYPWAWGGVLIVANIGTVALVLAGLAGWSTVQRIAAPITAAAFIAWLVPLTVGILRGKGVLATRLVLAAGLLGIVAALGLGALRLLGVELPGGAAAHPVLGLAGGLLVVVLGAGRAILPSLLAVPDGGWHRHAWSGVAIITMLMAWLTPWSSDLPAWWSGWGALLLVVAGLGLASLRQRRSARQSALAGAWAFAWLGLAACGMTLLAGGPEGRPLAALLAVALVIGTVVPATLLPITAFLQWWRLRTLVARGRQVPGLGLLQPEGLRRAWLAFRLPAAVCWVFALWPGPEPDRLRIALVLETAAAAVLVTAFLAPAWNARRFRNALSEEPVP